MIELERTYLARHIPKDLLNHPSKVVRTKYLPATAPHPKLRLRHYGDKYEMTKKQPVSDDASECEEQTIVLTKDEFEALWILPGKEANKRRYYYPYQGKTLEIDVYIDALAGLVVVDAEFDSPPEKALFVMPDFCLAEITHEEFIAGGKIAGKSYEDLSPELDRYKYQKIIVKP